MIVVALDIIDGRREVLAPNETLAAILTPRRPSAVRGVLADAVRVTAAAGAQLPAGTIAGLQALTTPSLATSRQASA